MNDKELLLKDLSGRLPYNPLISINDERYRMEEICNTLIGIDTYKITVNGCDIEYWNIKPYLFPLSSMTEEQRSEASIEFNLKKYMVNEYGDIESYHRIEDDIAYIDVENISRYIDWLNKNHFDYRNLINKNLAIDCTNLNIY